MKKLNLAGFLCGVLLFTAFGCEKNNNEIPIEFTFRLLDTLGNKSNTFNEGENIIFSFLMENKSSQDLNVENFFPIEEFFKVYKTNGELISFGTPYEGFCEIGFFAIPSKGIMELKVPWVVSDNPKHYGFCLLKSSDQITHLPKGKYFSAFSTIFNIDGSETDTKNFKVEFTVK